MSCSGCGTIINGVTGLAQAGIAATTGIGATPPDQFKARLRICWDCDKAQPLMIAGVPIVGKKSQCAECGCVIKAKASIAAENCPLGKWANQKT